ncbi:MAG: hypothetical protein AAF799_22285 [Myxococcota bacterium]
MKKLPVLTRPVSRSAAWAVRPSSAVRAKGIVRPASSSQTPNRDEMAKKLDDIDPKDCSQSAWLGGMKAVNGTFTALGSDLPKDTTEKMVENISEQKTMRQYSQRELELFTECRNDTSNSEGERRACSFGVMTQTQISKMLEKLEQCPLSNSGNSNQ